MTDEEYARRAYPPRSDYPNRPAGWYDHMLTVWAYCPACDSRCYRGTGFVDTGRCSGCGGDVQPCLPAPGEPAPAPAERAWAVGDRVRKSGGDYVFEGAVVAAFAKRSGAVRYVVEDERGLLFIFSGKQLEAARDSQQAL